MPGARRDARGGAAAEDHHPRRRGRRRGHRVLVAPPRPGARHHARARRAARRRPRGELHAATTRTRISSSASRTPTARSATRCGSRRRTIPVKPYVRLAHLASSTGDCISGAGKAPAAGRRRFRRRHDVLAGRMFITLGHFVDSAPYTSDYTYENIYYRSIAGEARGLPHGARLSLALGHRLVLVLEERAGAKRASCASLYGKKRLGSKTYTKIMRWNSRVGVTRKLERLLGLHSESVIQDVDIPIARAAEFLTFYAREIQTVAAVGLSDRAAARRAVSCSIPCGRAGTSTSASGT